GFAAAHALVDSVVLRVDGQQRDVVLASRFEDEVAGGDEALLVGQADGLAGADGGVGGLEPGDADDGGDHEVGLRMSCNSDGACSTPADFDPGETGFAEAGGGLGGEFFGGERDDFGLPAEALGGGFVEIAAGGEGDDLVAVGEGFADGEG